MSVDELEPAEESMHELKPAEVRVDELDELSELSDTTLELDELSDTTLDLSELSDTEDGAGLVAGRNEPCSAQKQRNQRKRQNMLDDDEKRVRNGDRPFTKAKRSNCDMLDWNELSDLCKFGEDVA
uniref:Uncharacterized protein n=1 Tax=Brassica oleracea var. oleracea TaxID=109376 RepID=A0A0D3AS92_BRAOL